jgi:hypothetical protein
MGSPDSLPIPFPAQAYAYVIGAIDGPQKIGVATTPTQRLVMLQSGNAASLVLSGAIPMSRAEAFAVERQAHWLLRDDRLRGEWFDVSPGEALAAVQQAYADVTAGRHQAERASKRPAGKLSTNSQWRDRLTAIGFSQKRFARFIGKTENTVSRQLRGEWEMPTYFKSIIKMLEILKPEQIVQVEAEIEMEMAIELKRRERTRPPETP